MTGRLVVKFLFDQTHAFRKCYVETSSHLWKCLFSLFTSGVARAFPGGRLAHPEGQNEEKISKVWGKIRKIDLNLRKNWGKWNSCPSGNVRLATALLFYECIQRVYIPFRFCIELHQTFYQIYWTFIDTVILKQLQFLVLFLWWILCRKKVLNKFKF